MDSQLEYWKSRAETAELKVLTFHEEIAKLGAHENDRTPQEAGLARVIVKDVRKCLEGGMELEQIEKSVAFKLTLLRGRGRL